jgi:pilus assembly protein CpaB
LRRTSRLVLLAGVFLAALTFIVIVLLLPGGGGGTGTTQPTAPTTQTVVVAAQDIPLGTVITKDMVTTATVPITGANGGAFQDPSQVVGKKATSAISSGAQVTADLFAASGAIHPDPGKGLRAFTIEVNKLTGVANVVTTGDFVDVLITETITVVQKTADGSVATIPGLDKSPTVKMPLLLENIPVIGAIDEAPAPATQANGQPAASTAPGITESKLLILALTPQQAEVMLFARTSGTIDVVYRSPQDTATVATDGVILKTLIDKYGVLPPNVVIVSVP